MGKHQRLTHRWLTLFDHTRGWHCALRLHKESVQCDTKKSRPASVASAS
jgi:hypothetical protein